MTLPGREDVSEVASASGPGDTLTNAGGMIPLVFSKSTEVDLLHLAEQGRMGKFDDEAAVTEFETAFSRLVGARGAVATNSGTSALHLALLAAGVQPGDDVILPSYTCVAVLNAVRITGANPVVVDNCCDVQQARFQIREDAVKEHLSSRTKAIIACQMFGKFTSLKTLCGFGVPVVDDFTLSLGASREPDLDKQSTIIGVCSLRHGKMISAGQGGVVTCNDATVLDRVRELCCYDEPVEKWRYMSEKELKGRYTTAYSYKMSAVQSILACSQLQQLPSFIQRRKEIAEYFSFEMGRLGIPCSRVPGDNSNVFFRYLVETARAVPAVLQDLLDCGIQAGRGVYPPLHMLLDMPDESFPGAMRAVHHLISLPIHPGLTDAQVEHLARNAQKLLSR